MRIVGLCGYARTGKDTVGKVLVEDHGFQRVSFADKLREFALASDPFVALDIDTHDGQAHYARLSLVVEAYGWEGAKDHEDVRTLLQKMGTEAGRRILGDDVWVRPCISALKEGGSYVFTDVRFQNEADAIRANGGEVWRVVRPGHGPINGHPSETSLDGYPVDWTIHNTGTLQALVKEVGTYVISLQTCCGVGIEFSLSTGGHPKDHPEECE